MPQPTPPPEYLIDAQDLSVRLGGVAVLRGVDLWVRPREIVTLIGPNGSGKTTLLRALLGLVPSHGTIWRKAGLRIGYVPQQFPRDRAMPLTAGRFMALFGKTDAASRENSLARVGMAACARRQISTLSGGEMARVMLARAIATKPDLLILDEPLAGVDVAGEAALYRLIAQLRDEIGCAVLLVSHDLHVVMAQADRVVCLNGHVCCAGSAEQVVRDPAFADLFGARAADALALYAHHHDHRHEPSGAVAEPRHG